MAVTILGNLKSEKNNHSDVDGIGSCRASIPPVILNELMNNEQWEWIWENNSTMEKFLVLNPHLDERYRNKFPLLEVLTKPLINDIKIVSVR